MVCDQQNKFSASVRDGQMCHAFVTTLHTCSTTYVSVVTSHQSYGVGVETGDRVSRSRPFWLESELELESVKSDSPANTRTSQYAVLVGK